MVDYDPANQNSPDAPLPVPGGKPSIVDLKTAIAASSVAARYPAATLLSSTKNDLIYICRLHGIQVPGLPGSGDYSIAAPVITVQPANISKTAPATALFTVTATGDTPISYQWERQAAGSGPWVAISGATSASYTTPATTVSGGTANNTDKYRCVVTNPGGATTSSAATLTVTA